jgi:Domain of Unknown Function (DUF1599).|uniref:Nucleotide modification associated domain 1 n=1 Tax=Siphoviridae sp. ctWKa2 TaxID=2825537 RepID=A0A8S5PGI3_9CAUD|nr:MAG TPA: Nucleotide modification associated domain 1 [Siphoviridae sp. ctWKa2]
MAKLNPTTMKTQYDGQYDTFCRKNHDYGNSFEESLDQFGIIASLVRMQDKMLRLQSLTDDSKTQQVGSESLLDTLEDLSNYAAMTACWLKGVQAEDDVVNKSFHAVKDLIETCDDSDVKYNELYHKRMINSLYGAHIFRTPGENWKTIQCDNGFKPLGAEIETELPEETIGMYIDRMLSELYSRIDVWGYNDQEKYHEFVNFAETTVKEIIKNNVPISELQKHIDVFPNFSQAYKNSLKSQCMKEYNKVEQVHPNEEADRLKKFIEEVTDDIISVVLIKQRDEKMLVPADLDDDTSRIIKCITDNEFDPNYVVSYMEALMGNAGIPPYLREWIRGIILRGVYYRNKGRSMTKAKDKARGVVMKGSRGNSNVIVMASRGSGKGLMKTKSLLEELGVPKEDIKEIFEGLEDDDE